MPEYYQQKSEGSWDEVIQIWMENICAKLIQLWPEYLFLKQCSERIVLHFCGKSKLKELQQQYYCVWLL